MSLWRANIIETRDATVNPVWTLDILKSQQLNKRDSAYWSKHYKDLVSDFTNRSGIDDKAAALADAQERADLVFQYVCNARNAQGVPNAKDA
jgi:hypothetical protein